MSRTMKELGDALQDALRRETAVWSPQCPHPVTLLDWIEQEDAHPQAAWLLDHIISCAYCRRETMVMRETWALAREPIPQAIGASTAGEVTAGPPQAAGEQIGLEILRTLPRKVAGWAHELLTEGITAPIKSVREALDQLSRLTATPSPVLVRGEDSPANLRPLFTAVRSPLPVLRWSAVEAAQEVTVVVTQQERNRRKLVWKGSAGTGLELTLPEQAGLKPGGIYTWQVIAQVAGRESPSAPASFTILTEPTRRQLETLESRAKGSALALIGLYEAYGLYDEALQQVEQLLRLNPADAFAFAMQTKLQQQPY